MTIDLSPVKKEGSLKSTNRNYPGQPITDIVINGFFTISKNWQVTYWNHAAERLLGIKSIDIIGKNVWEALIDILPVEFYALFDKAFKQENPLSFQEYWGEMGLWYEVTTYHNDGDLSVSFKCCSSVSDDITYASTEPPLRILNQLYRYITEVTNDCLWEWNLRNQEIFWIDGGHKRLFGYNIQNTLVPQNFWESCIHPDDKEELFNSINLVIHAGEAAWEHEYRFKNAAGEYAFVHDRGHIIYSDDNTPSRIIGATRDISRRKNAENDLQESQRKLALIALQSNDPIIISNSEGIITWVNSAYSNKTGYQAEEVLGNSFPFLTGEETDRDTLDFLYSKMKLGEAVECNLLEYLKNGEKCWMNIKGQPILDKDGNFESYFTIKKDISEKMLVDNKLRSDIRLKHMRTTNAVISALEKDRDNFGTELYDNLGQIMSVSKLYLQMAQKPGKNKRQYLEKSASFMAEVIDEIRKISKKIVFAKPSIVSLIDNLKTMVRDSNEVNGTQITLKVEGLDPMLISENMQLATYRIIQEQISNIVIHSNAGRANINIVQDANWLKLKISDNGKGCDPEEEGKGIGILNIICRAELLLGKVAIDSSPGHGYSMEVVFPLAAIDGITPENV